MSRVQASGVRIAIVAVAIAAVTAVYAAITVTPTTVALTYVVVVLLFAAKCGLVESTVAAVLATAAFNVFFLPPIGTLSIADPQNWVAFVAFLITALVASQLSGRARRRAIDAEARQQELERLYALS